MVLPNFECYRFYVGRQPRIAISDVDLAKDIMVKEFDNFSDRGFLVRQNSASLLCIPDARPAAGEAMCARKCAHMRACRLDSFVNTTRNKSLVRGVYSIEVLKETTYGQI